MNEVKSGCRDSNGSSDSNDSSDSNGSSDDPLANKPDLKADYARLDALGVHPAKPAPGVKTMEDAFKFLHGFRTAEIRKDMLYLLVNNNEGALRPQNCGQIGDILNLFEIGDDRLHAFISIVRSRPRAPWPEDMDHGMYTWINSQTTACPGSFLLVMTAMNDLGEIAFPRKRAAWRRAADYVFRLHGQALEQKHGSCHVVDCRRCLERSFNPRGLN